MARKHEEKQERYDEGFVRGKRALMIGIFPVFIFLGTVVFGAWILVDYYNKVTVNQDNSDICKLVRQHNPATIKAEYPCGLTEKPDYWIVSFNENIGSTTSVPAYISYKVSKSDKSITPASSTQ